MKIFACGGAGINVASRFEEMSKQKSAVRAEMSISYFDTSEANIDYNKNANKENFYLIESEDTKKGSGKKRDDKYDLIREHTNNIMLNNPPETFNVVLHSASGGSGSVIGPVIVSELLKKDVVVVVLMIGSSDSNIEMNNTIKTFASYQKITTLRKRPVVTGYFENSKTEPRSSVDDKVENFIKLLSIVLSDKNQEMDTMDVYNFFNYDRVTDHAPDLVGLDILSGENITVNKNYLPISCLTVARRDQATSVNFNVDYKTDGFINEASSKMELIEDVLPIHAVIMEGAIHGVVNTLEQAIANHSKEKSAKIVKKFTTDYEGEDDGLVL